MAPSRRAFSLIEMLIVVMLISAGILPIYSIIKSGQRRIVRADNRTLATLFGASAIELARTLGYDKCLQKLENQPDFQELMANAHKNGYKITSHTTTQDLKVPKDGRPTKLLRVEITVGNIRTMSVVDVKEIVFVTILSDPRYNFY